MSNPDLQALLAQLRPRSQASSISRDQSRDLSSSFPTASRIPSTPPPPFSPTPADANIPAHPAGNAATAQNLLNLLNFGQAQSHPTVSRPQSQLSTPSQQYHSQPHPPQSFEPSSRTSSAAFQNLDVNGGSSQNPPNPLLNLLNRSVSQNTTTHAHSQQESPRHNGSQVKGKHEPHARAVSDMSISVGDTAPDEPHETETPPPQRPIFTYTNPFEALKASRSTTSKALSTTQGEANAALPTRPAIPEPSANMVENGSKTESVERVKLTPASRSPKPVTNAMSYPFPNTEPATTPTADKTRQISNFSETNGDGEHNESQDTDQNATPRAQSQAIHQNGTQPQLDVTATTDTLGKRVVPVLTFPIKAFVSITLQPTDPSDIHFREESVMEISRLKKDFDQIDRSLATASSNYITYAFVKNGGMRIIRQDDGSDRSVFKNSHDRVFNVSLCTTALQNPPSDHQAVLGTGISGAVYYATISRGAHDYFQDNELEVESLVFPAFPPVDENTAGGVLKTRAKRSSRHPEFFAIGRGRTIQIVWPSTAMSPRYGITNSNRQVDAETYYYERGLTVSTGKAGKDFTFSEDDTIIASLDKSGRLRFWDIRKLIDEENALAARPTPVEVDRPVLSLATASAAEKSWPTSVLFVDKARPYSKGGALRYVLVGLRQNHTLQLWDIALGKAVQEINFPHENETDGICSVNYHPSSGIISVGHPTRNSVFFIHLSAPRYTLSPTMSQASYVQRVADKDPELPKPDSTACMSGIREVSLGLRGQLRSVEMLPIHKPADTPKGANDERALFELYIVHSKGVTCFAVNKEDLGWNADNKVIRSLDAEKEGVVTLKDLKLGSVIDENIVHSPTRETSQQPNKSSKKKKKAKDAAATELKKTELSQEQAVPAQNATESLDPAPEPGVAKETSKNRKKAIQAESLTTSTAEYSRSVTPDKGFISSGSQNEGKVPGPAVSTPTMQERSEAVSLGISGDWLDKEMKKIERGVSTEFRKELDILRDNLKNDRSTQDRMSSERQEAVLRLVSSSLNTNVEASLSRILSAQMQEVVVPTVVQSVSSQLSENVASAISRSVSAEVGTLLPVVVQEAVQAPSFVASIAQVVSKEVVSVVKESISAELHKTVTPLLHQNASRVASSESMVLKRLDELEAQRQVDASKIDSLNRALQSMASTLQTMTESQVAFQSQILKERRSLAQAQAEMTAQAAPPQAHSPAPSAQPSQVRRSISSEANTEFDEVATLMEQRRYEEGSIKWLQSAQPVKLFDELFVRFTPEYLATDVSPLVAFSIGVTVANSLETNADQRLEWISAAFNAVDFKDHEITELAQHAPQLLIALEGKLERLFMDRANTDRSDPILSHVREVLKQAQDLKHAFNNMGGGTNGGVGGARYID